MSRTVHQRAARTLPVLRGVVIVLLACARLILARARGHRRCCFCGELLGDDAMRYPRDVGRYFHPACTPSARAQRARDLE